LCGIMLKNLIFRFWQEEWLLTKYHYLKTNLFGKKPWEIPHLDTLELWKFGITSTSLKLMCKVLGIPSPKVTSMVVKWTCFYVDKDIDRIVAYWKTLLLLLRFFSDLEEKSYWLTRLFTFNRPLSDISINGN
jgi:hypothetical protein